MPVKRLKVFPVQCRVLLESDYEGITMQKTLATSSSHNVYCFEHTPIWDENGMQKKKKKGEKQDGKKLIADLLDNGNEAMMVNDCLGSGKNANVAFLEVEVLTTF